MGAQRSSDLLQQPVQPILGSGGPRARAPPVPAAGRALTPQQLLPQPAGSPAPSGYRPACRGGVLRWGSPPIPIPSWALQCPGKPRHPRGYSRADTLPRRRGPSLAAVAVRPPSVQRCRAGPWAASWCCWRGRQRGTELLGGCPGQALALELTVPMLGLCPPPACAQPAAGDSWLGPYLGANRAKLLPPVGTPAALPVPTQATAPGSFPHGSRPPTPSPARAALREGDFQPRGRVAAAQGAPGLSPARKRGRPQLFSTVGPWSFHLRSRWRGGCTSSPFHIGDLTPSSNGRSAQRRADRQQAPDPPCAHTH